MMRQGEEAGKPQRDAALDHVRAYLASLSDPAARAFPQKLLAALAIQDRDTLEALLRANPAVAALYDTCPPAKRSPNAAVKAFRRVLRSAAAGGADAPSTSAFQRAVECTKAQWAERRRVAASERPAAEPVEVELAPLGFPGEASGVLTDMTRQLDPEMALELYRKITPMLVFTVFKRLERSARLDQVHAVTERLCGEAAQGRFREAEHVRDAIVDELCKALGDADIRRDLDRASLLEIMEECGAMADLAAMVNCITLSKTRAG